MIVKNEEDTLPRCLESVQGLVEEIVIVDTGSTDRTREVALAYTDKLYEFPWRDDFSAARNASFSQATQQYCLWLDADDVIDPESREGFLELKALLPPQTDVVMLPYHTAFDEQGRPSFTYYRERLIRRLSGLSWRGAVHEAIAPVGNVVYWEKAAVSHRKTRAGDPDRNLRILEGLLAQGKELSPGSSFITPGSWPPMAGMRKRLSFGKSFWPREKAGWKTSWKPAGIWPSVTSARGNQRRPSVP